MPEPSQANVFTIDLDVLIDPSRRVSAFASPYMMATIVFAEKGARSTSEARPSQQHYRSSDEWHTYRANLVRIRQNPRAHLVRTAGPITFEGFSPGHLFVAEDFGARNPSVEILKHRPIATFTRVVKSKSFWRKLIAAD
jgi:hypothetical protein